ncbi:hypothetical protein HDU97_000491 [Phlyctochytrium planicorne]|nr:hypothetical protein HDU97_000491 [Phlyctochytrium planicorne]
MSHPFTSTNDFTFRPPQPPSNTSSRPGTSTTELDFTFDEAALLNESAHMMFGSSGNSRTIRPSGPRDFESSASRASARVLNDDDDDGEDRFFFSGMGPFESSSVGEGSSRPMQQTPAQEPRRKEPSFVIDLTSPYVAASGSNGSSAGSSGSSRAPPKKVPAIERRTSVESNAARLEDPFGSNSNPFARGGLSSASMMPSWELFQFSSGSEVAPYLLEDDEDVGNRFSFGAGSSSSPFTVASSSFSGGNNKTFSFGANNGSSSSGSGSTALFSRESNVRDPRGPQSSQFEIFDSEENDPFRNPLVNRNEPRISFNQPSSSSLGSSSPSSSSSSRRLAKPRTARPSSSSTPSRQRTRPSHLQPQPRNPLPNLPSTYSSSSTSFSRSTPLAPITIDDDSDLEPADLDLIQQLHEQDRLQQQPDPTLDLDLILAQQLQREEEEAAAAAASSRFSPERGAYARGGRLPTLPQQRDFGVDDETPVDRLMRRLRAEHYLRDMHRDVMGRRNGHPADDDSDDDENVPERELFFRLMEMQMLGGVEDPFPLAAGLGGGGREREEEDAATYESLLSLAEEVGPAVNLGATEEEIGALPRRVLKRKDALLEGGGEAQRCAICLEEFAVGDEVVGVARCLHFFHGTCGGEWFKRSKKCPTCRVDITEG